ncbi:MAG: isoleucine--tRNA ligase, partial [Propionibacteriaceae bacterium]|nr:isoleucine--tRNA ligase [Propionibacteriaceae bacterium]
MPYNDVPASYDLPKMEHGILDFWDQTDVFHKSMDATVGGKEWTFYEGPPTANGMPGTHHIEARVFKDIFPRFKTMQGYHVERRAGWDCHGLPVELAVEKELGFNGKPDIERYGVKAFNEKCRESVSRHVDAFTQLTRRMGYWVDLDRAYWTMNPEYVESVWWALKQIHSKGLLVEDYRVAPYCPRCGTTLSDHELAQGYQDITDTSVFVRFPLTAGPLAGKASLLVWTTTPWTLVSNTAVAVHPDVTYVVAHKDEPNGENLVVAQELAESVLGEGWSYGKTYKGSEMELWAYQRPFEIVEMPQVVGGANYVILADYVTTSDGSGLVHEAPAFGAEDMEAARPYGLPLVNPVLPNGHFEDGLDIVGGMFFRDANPPLVQDLLDRKLLFKRVDITHSYPHCWRCDTVLIYYAQPSWYIRTTAIKDELLRENKATNWYPETIKWGRYGDWLNNNIDWALSRSRYWGTPLPIWRCADKHETVVGSRAELSKLVGEDLSELDPHRPFVDEVVFSCPVCNKEARRVPEVIDAWFDSGSMPFAQLGYPHKPGSDVALKNSYPADFICEAIDQTRGWFYSLMAVGTLVFDKSSYKNVLCLGHILAEDGRKMSKHLGNILEPIPLMESNGADAVRWFMACGGSPWASRRVGFGTMAETVRKVIMTLNNTVSFQAMYARANGWSPAPGEAPAYAQAAEGAVDDALNLAPKLEDRHVLDRWLVSATKQLVIKVTDALEDFDTQLAGTLLSDFVDELSNWYVRRSRRRFWAGDADALWTLHETLEILVRLMAPIMPFVTERIWQDIVVPVTPDAPESVHLASWPTASEDEVDVELMESMKLTKRLVELGRSSRAEAKIKNRQPLRRLLVSSGALRRLSDELVEEIKAELNVLSVESFAAAGDLVSYSAKGNFRALGKRFGKQTPIVASWIAAADAAELAASLKERGVYDAQIDGFDEPIALSAEDVIISETPLEGWSVVNEQGETVALDLELDDELRSAGLAREVVRMVQEARKTSGFDVSDRIVLEWSAEGTTADAIARHSDMIASEVLAAEMLRADLPAYTEGGEVFGDAELGLSFRVA